MRQQFPSRCLHRAKQRVTCECSGTPHFYDELCLQIAVTQPTHCDRLRLPRAVPREIRHVGLVDRVLSAVRQYPELGKTELYIQRDCFERQRACG